MTAENKLLAHMLDASGDKQACESCVGTGLIGGTECAWCVQPVAGDASGDKRGDEPVAAESRFVNTDKEWLRCSIEHARMVLAKPLACVGYEARYLYTGEQLQAARAAAMEESAKDTAELRRIGSLLANCAFNLAQRADRPLTLETAATLGRLREEWDAAIAGGAR